MGTSVVHRRYIGAAETHYGAGLVSGAFVLGLFGDAATELSIRTDGEEGLLVSYEDVQFMSPVQGGDVLQVEAVILGVGRRSRKLRFEASVTCRATSEERPARAVVLEPPLTVATAVGTVVVREPADELDRPERSSN